MILSFLYSCIACETGRRDAEPDAQAARARRRLLLPRDGRSRSAAPNRRAAPRLVERALDRGGLLRARRSRSPRGVAMKALTFHFSYPRFVAGKIFGGLSRGGPLVYEDVPDAKL